MLENDTSDPAAPAVLACVRRIGAQPQACELNFEYKTAYCEVLVQKRKYKGSVEACAKDPKVTNSYGVGGAV